ncbi:MAG: hypothetical protein ABID54_05660 [Pseudomonadota bacterium]
MAAKKYYPREIQEEMIDLYLHQKESVYSIAESFSLPYSAVYDILKKNGVKSKVQSRREEVLLLLPSSPVIVSHYRKDYLSPSTIAKRYCRGNSELLPKLESLVRNTLKEEGVRLDWRRRPPRICIRCRRSVRSPMQRFHLSFCSTACLSSWLSDNTDSHGLCTSPIFYVYGLATPISVNLNSGRNLVFSAGDTFYVGKGHGPRAWEHLKNNDRQNSWKREVIDFIQNEGNKVRVLMLEENVSEGRSFALEIEWIEKIGLENLTNVHSGGIGKTASKKTKEYLSYLGKKLRRDHPEWAEKNREAMLDKINTPWAKARHAKSMRRLRERHPWFAEVKRLLWNFHRHSVPFPKEIRRAMRKLYRRKYIQREKVSLVEFVLENELSDFFSSSLPLLKQKIPEKVAKMYLKEGLEDSEIVKRIPLVSLSQVKDITSPMRTLNNVRMLAGFINGEDFSDLVNSLISEGHRSVGAITGRVGLMIQDRFPFAKGGRDYGYIRLARKRIEKICKDEGIALRDGFPGRPRMENRTRLSLQDKKYIGLRSSGRSCEESASLVGRPTKEMRRMEREHPLMIVELEHLR